MKKIILVMVIPFLILAFLQPSLTLAGASEGLMIWFQKLIPTLLPFLIAINLLQNGDIFSAVIARFPRAGSTVATLVTAIPGFLFGQPVGAKLAADFTKKAQISARMGHILLWTCNHLSPAFVGTYVMIQCLDVPELIGVSCAILYLPAALALLAALLFLQRRSRRPGSSPGETGQMVSKKASGFQTLFQILDASIIDGFETITKLGGYLILFGILCSYLEHLLPVPETVKGCLMMLFEVTNGIYYFASCTLPFPQKYALCMCAISFGGLCTHAQTYSVITGTPLSKKSYFAAKLLLALLTFILSSLAGRMLFR